MSSSILNIEFKACVNNLPEMEARLRTLNPLFIGEDQQIDTYFVVPSGRLKLREGNIENALIHYKRDNTADAKMSKVLLYKHVPDATLKQILIHSLGIKIVVEKRRRIYFIDNVKFHFDTLEQLGTFVEVEAIDENQSRNKTDLQIQCQYYADFLGIAPSNYVAESYSDLLMSKAL